MSNKLFKRKSNPNSLGWLLTYSDMITLVLAFLAILIGSKNMGLDVKPFIQAFNGNISILNTGHGQNSLINVPSVVRIPKEKKNRSKTKKKKSINIELQKILTIKNIKFEKTTRGIRVFLFDNFFFDLDSDKVDINNPKTKEVLKNSREFFDTLFNETKMKKQNKIIFEGYAEIQEKNPLLLSFSRARNLINALSSIDSPYSFNEKLISIQSYGNSLSTKEESSDERAYQRKVSVIITLEE